MCDQPSLPGMRNTAPDPSADDAGSRVVFTFPTRGGGRWTMSRNLLHRLRGEFPYLHVDAKIQQLVAWVEGIEEDRRKHPGSMAGWLRGILARDNAEALQVPGVLPVHYEGWSHPSLPTDPTDQEVVALLAGATAEEAA